MNIIRFALRSPISVMVAVIGIAFFSVLAALNIPIDIFPNLDLPTIYVVQPYGGMAPDKMDGFIAARYQDQFLYVSGIRNIGVKSIQGLSLLKLQFYPGTNMAQAAAEVSLQIARAQSYMPQGTVPPQVVRFDASSIPVGQLVFESSTRPLNEVQDYAASRIRPMFSTIPGVSSPPPFGGNQRTIIVKIDPNRMRSYSLTPEEVVKAIARNNQPSAAGNLRMGKQLLMTPVNSLVRQPQDFLDVPIRMGAGPAVYIRDVGTVEDGADVTVGYALVNGKRAVYIPVVKKADASTVEAVNNVKNALPRLRAAVPEDVRISYEFDQSVYVVNALKSLVTEGVIGALLTGLMVLLFLRDVRSVIIVVLTIPISLAAALILLNLFGQTINIMTLSGLALAIGILVDQATVTIENIHQHLEHGETKAVAIWRACKEIFFPELLILFAILAVFAPAFIMSGVPKSLFLPLSLSVGFAMIASFLLAQTFVPVMANWLMKSHPVHNHPTLDHPTVALTHGAAGEVITDQAHPGKLKGFDRFKARYTQLLNRLMKQSGLVVGVYVVASIGLAVLGFSVIGTDILPKTNAGQFQLRMRDPDGTRIEQTERDFLRLLGIIKREVGAENMEISSAYVGTQPSSYGASNIFIFTSGPHEALLQVALREEYKVNMNELRENIRMQVAKEMPAVKISFEPIELTEKIMSQGANTPIEVNVAAKDISEANRHAQRIMAEMREIPYLRDVQIAQPLNYPILDIHLNRELAGQLNITPQEISRSMVDATSSSRFTEKNLWLDEKKGLAYQVQVQIPEYIMSKENDIRDIPLRSGLDRTMLTDVATFTRKTMPGEYDREGPNRLVTVTANLQNRDLGSATKDVESAISRAGEPPRGVLVDLRGQVSLLSETLNSLQLGLGVAVVVIFLLLSANYQSFKLSFVILSTLPAVLAGSLLMLLATGSTLNLQSYMGMIMSVGVSVANAILLVTNAETLRLETRSATKASLLAANSRIRPILMTSIAMVMGMIPMASGLGEGGDQVAPLGRAVIGGLIASTFAALIILPNVFKLVQEKTTFSSVSLDPEDVTSSYYEPAAKCKPN